MIWSRLFACTPLDLDSPGETADASTAGDAATDSGSGSGDSADSSGDSADSGGDTNPGTLHGTAPADPLPVPDFEAINRDGKSRSKPDLVGHPTVVWFYPLANTSG